MIKRIVTSIILSCLLLNTYSQNNENTSKWEGTITNSYFEKLTYYEPEIFERSFERNSIFEHNGESIRTQGMTLKYVLKSSRKGCYLVDILTSFKNKIYLDYKLIFQYIYPNYSYTNVLISLNEDTQLMMKMSTCPRNPFIKFINLRKLNKITSNNPKIIYSGSTPTKITGTYVPEKTYISNAHNGAIKDMKYKWEMLDENKKWVRAPGIYSKYYYTPPELSCINNKETVYTFRRVATYSQFQNAVLNTYSDETAIATVIVKPRLSPSLSCDKDICEGDNLIKLKFIGCLPACDPDEKYNIIINDGTKEYVFNSIVSGSYLSFDYKETTSKIFKIINISNESGTQNISYNKGEEPSITISKKGNIRTKNIHTEY